LCTMSGEETLRATGKPIWKLSSGLISSLRARFSGGFPSSQESRKLQHSNNPFIFTSPLMTLIVSKDCSWLSGTFRRRKDCEHFFLSCLFIPSSQTPGGDVITPITVLKASIF
jgi:hypothetical protein